MEPLQHNKNTHQPTMKFYIRSISTSAVGEIRLDLIAREWMVQVCVKPLLEDVRGYLGVIVLRPIAFLPSRAGLLLGEVLVLGSWDRSCQRALALGARP